MTDPYNCDVFDGSGHGEKRWWSRIEWPRSWIRWNWSQERVLLHIVVSTLFQVSGEWLK
jgi:hypothetical protein